MTEKIKCKGCGKLLKPEELEYKIGDLAIFKTSYFPLAEQGMIEPYCKVCIEKFTRDDN